MLESDHRFRHSDRESANFQSTSSSIPDSIDDHHIRTSSLKAARDSFTFNIRLPSQYGSSLVLDKMAQIN